MTPPFEGTIAIRQSNFTYPGCQFVVIWAMNVNGTAYRTVWLNEDREGEAMIIDQRWLPFRFVEETLRTTEDAATAIRDMHVRGAGCIGAVAAHGVYISACEAAAAGPGAFKKTLREKADLLVSTRPTAVNLKWAVDRQLDAIFPRIRSRNGCPRRVVWPARLPMKTPSGVAELVNTESLHRGDRSPEIGRTGQYSDPLQCRLVGFCRSWLGDCSDLCGA